MRAAGLILAAGLSSRMGSLKQLLPLNGKPFIAHAADLFFDAGVTDVRVVLGFRAQEVQAALAPRPIRFLHNDAFASTEMFDSVRIGLGDLINDRVGRVFLLPADMPYVPSSILPLLYARMDETDADAVFPSRNMRRLHPPLLNAACMKRLYAYDGTNGLRGGFAACVEHAEYVVTDEIGCTIDVDTPDDYARLLALSADKAHGSRS